MATLPKGKSFGELALLENQPRNATIITTTPTLFLVLDRHDYITLLKEWQDIQLREKVDFLSVRRKKN